MRTLLFAALAVGTGALVVSCSLLNKPDPIKAGTGSGGGGSCMMASDCQSPGPLPACQVADCQNGKCTTKNADDGTMCDDGKFCSATMSGTCQAGACTGVTPKVCAGANACMLSDCNESAKTCGTKPAQDGTDCGAGPDVCTAHATCQTGTCTMPPKKCESQTTDCMDVVCDTGSKNCMSTPKNANMPCNVMQQCKLQGLCTATGICGPDPSNPSFTGMNKPDNTCCDDGLGCTLGDKCTAGKCQGVSICPADNGCVKYKCTEPPPPMMGMMPTPAVCTTTTQNDGMPCMANTCFSGTTCLSGACQGGTKVSNVVFYDDFHDNSQGWQLGPQWEIGPAKASPPFACGSSDTPQGSQDPAYDHTRRADNGVAGVVIGGNEMPPPIGGPQVITCLTSPTVNTAATVGSLYLSFYRWLNSDYPPYMIDTVEVSTDDGATWSDGVAPHAAPLYSNPTSPPPLVDTPNIGGQGWTFQNFEITNFKSANMRVRFCLKLTSGAYSVGSWNVDDVLISAGQVCI